MPRTAWYGERKSKNDCTTLCLTTAGGSEHGFVGKPGHARPERVPVRSHPPPKGRMAEEWRDGAAHGPKVKSGAHAGRNRSRPERATACSGLWVVQTRNRVGMRWPQPSQGLGRPQTHKTVPGLPASMARHSGRSTTGFSGGQSLLQGGVLPRRLERRPSLR